MLFPPILPTSAVHTPVRLKDHQSARCILVKVMRVADLLTNPLPAVLALNSLLDDRIARNPIVQIGNKIQRKTKPNEVEALVEKCSVIAVKTSRIPDLLKADSSTGGSLPISHDHSPIIKRLLHGIVPLPFSIMPSPPEDGEFLLHISIYEREERERREENLGHE